MKLAVHVDFYANLRALEAVLKDAHTRNFERSRSMSDIRHLICSANGPDYPQYGDRSIPSDANDWDPASGFSSIFACFHNPNTHHS